MNVIKQETVPIKNQNDIVLCRKITRIWCVEMGLSLTDQTKVVTAASELARNTLEHGHGGEMQIELVNSEQSTTGLRLIFEDLGPGINNVKLALTDGYTSGRGMGMGLSGSKRLMNEFNLETQPGKGTRVTVTKWK